MRKTFTNFIFLLPFFVAFGLQAQTIVRVNTNDAECKVALISDEDAAKGEYGWWSIWQELNGNSTVASAPTTFKPEPGTYTLVVYWVNNNDRSDGIALEKIHIAPYITEINYSFHQDDFTEWNCLSCPWLCVFNGATFDKQEEVIKDVVGFENRTTTAAKLSPSAVIDGKVRIQIKEEKDEISYLDRVVLQVGDEILHPDVCDAKLLNQDDDFFALHKGENVELEFTLPKGLNGDMQVLVTGFYHPEPGFMEAITARLLDK